MMDGRTHPLPAAFAITALVWFWFAYSPPGGTVKTDTKHALYVKKIETRTMLSQSCLQLMRLSYPAQLYIVKEASFLGLVSAPKMYRQR